MTHPTQFLILVEPTQVPRDGTADGSGGSSGVLVYCFFAVVVVSAVAAVLIFKRSSDGEQKWSLSRVLAVVALATVAVVGAVVSVGICLDSVRDLFS
ncbi:hypothetical protein [Corynebacterium variabile]|uniref:hypothetical protein n=1 Tax=Corynebacterium variabile TaxID=1727 RepID=UPI003F9D9D65